MKTKWIKWLPEGTLFRITGWARLLPNGKSETLFPKVKEKRKKVKTNE